jgi:hypothetical protein
MTMSHDIWSWQSKKSIHDLKFLFIPDEWNYEVEKLWSWSAYNFADIIHFILQMQVHFMQVHFKDTKWNNIILYYKILLFTIIVHQSPDWWLNNKIWKSALSQILQTPEDPPSLVRVYLSTTAWSTPLITSFLWCDLNAISLPASFLWCDLSLLWCDLGPLYIKFSSNCSPVSKFQLFSTSWRIVHPDRP